MMTAEWIFGWWNLVFLAPFLLALIYLGVYAASGVTFGDADADAGVDADADVDADMDHDLGGDVGHDIDADADHDFGADADADADADTDHDAGGDQDGDAGGHSSVFAALTWLGVGRVPLSIVLMVLLLSWGAIGFATNVLARDLFADPGRLIMLSLPAALAGSMLVTGGISKAIVKLIPLNETFAHRRHELLGSVGEAVFMIDQAGGVVMVRDEEGNLSQVAARVQEGEGPIAKGNKVRLVAYDGPRKLFFARPHDPAASANAGLRV